MFLHDGADPRKLGIQIWIASWNERATIMPRNWPRFESAGSAVFFGIQQFGETRVFLQEREIFIVTRVIAIFRPEFDGNFQVFHGGIGLASQAIKSGEG